MISDLMRDLTCTSIAAVCLLVGWSTASAERVSWEGAAGGNASVAHPADLNPFVDRDEYHQHQSPLCQTRHNTKRIQWVKPSIGGVNGRRQIQPPDQ